ncbi:hypothetical protein I305_05244 [Cryptococcus gattii E566]|uniref:Uncharacterized protein n=2 Tax=Cryptococcus gattii TaxID=37769 RepID=E6R7R4_CRYGW|nr:Hypothetical Protein CGB_F1250C [Cryptococcus gattii WM276]ADV22876.1 Hypothetical Protein CGB_F1250C [Cryptococcus gattii WM276]KIR82821.1 hypothetical protein I306_00091 [Cryptococcus gattii EJB2]KIY32290.1 hypothetical protein I305_05244 [Cryptococcus gattii E566]KJE04706.1 hypothetical protein I311_01510 [Cryptococcus gattii NT-10]
MWSAESLESHEIFSKETTSFQYSTLSIGRSTRSILLFLLMVPNQNLQLPKPAFQDHPLFSPGAMQEEQDVISRGEANSTGTHTHDMIPPLIQVSPLITFDISSIALFAPQCSASSVEHLYIVARTDDDLLQDGNRLSLIILELSDSPLPIEAFDAIIILSGIHIIRQGGPSPNLQQSIGVKLLTWHQMIRVMTVLTAIRGQ